MKKLLILTCTGAAALALAGCADPHYRTSRTTYTTVQHDPEVAYYNGYYGPYVDGYWGSDGYFYYSDRDRHYYRDNARHFRRDPYDGGVSVRAKVGIR